MHRLGSLFLYGVLAWELALMPLAPAHAEEAQGEELLVVLPVAAKAQLEYVRAGTAIVQDLPPLTTSVILWDEARPPTPPIRNATEQVSVTGQMNTFQR